MPKPRKRLVSLDDTPYYDCFSRCVRRAFLCGVDDRDLLIIGLFVLLFVQPNPTSLHFQVN